MTINPLLAVIATIIKMTLYETPISNGFNLTSLLSGVFPSNLACLDILRGAALSGQLK